MPPRLEQLRSQMSEHALDALLVTKRENIFYLSGFSGSNGVLLVTHDRQLLISDFRYTLQAEEEAPEWTFIQSEQTLIVGIRKEMENLGVARIGYDPDNVTVNFYRQLSEEELAPSYQLLPAPGLVEQLRIIKEPDELEIIRHAVRITDAAYLHILGIVTPGMTERELALEAEWHMRRHGADGMAFEIIAAGGEHGALPHAQPGDRPLRPGDMVVLDMGARYDHYCADMTRTFAIADASPTAREIYRICAQAQLAGVNGIHAGMTGREADAVVRTVIEMAGYGAYFGHGTGHGVGVEVHEAPRLSRLYEGVIPVGSVVTVEPGIYLPGVGGVRIEDLVLVTETGVDIFTHAPKPIELPVQG